MSTTKKHNNIANIDSLDDSLEDSIRFLADLTRKEIEKTYNNGNEKSFHQIYRPA